MTLSSSLKQSRSRTKLAAAVALCFSFSNAVADTPLEEVFVTADFAQTSLATIPEAATVVSAEDIRERSAEHLEQILSFAPNVNYSAGSSRGRYFQIRGIGERSQFIDPVNPSVGLVIDGIDMTGLGGAATLFDIQQVEILRGPQGTRFGANALAGMINIKSNDPTEETEGYLKARIGNYDSYGFGAALSGALSNNLLGRFAISSFDSNGYIDNTFLNRDDTNNIDELVARGKLAYQVSDATQLQLTYLYADIDNGYDAFSLDNTRETLSDEPGVDSQDTSAIALSLNSKLNDSLMLETIVTDSDSDIEYSYDEDWTFVGIEPDWEYSSFDQYLRNYDRQSIDLRLSSNSKIFADSTEWTAGVYSLQRDESLNRNYTFAGPFNSTLAVDSLAVYGELRTQLSDSVRLIAGLRLENWENNYQDSNGVNGSTDEDLEGGKLTLEKQFNESQLGYVSLARGYKAGGVNSNPDVSAANRQFDTEYNVSLELGFKSAWSDNFSTALSVFVIDRKDQQVKSSYAVQDPTTNATSFQDFLSNAAEGKNQGIEIEGNWDVNDNLNWTFSLGYLDTEFSDYSFQTDDGEFNITGREQAHAPKYSAATAVTYAFNNALSLRLEAEAKDEFFFSDSHDLKSDAYQLLHARLEYSTDNYSVALYGRNLTDEEYATRGFGFANDPRDFYTSVGYIQLGEPRLLGIEAQINF
jgi:outer membrane receptor protein involved in Fe transport